MTALYQLAEEFKSAKESLMSSDFDEQTIKDTLDSLSADIENKIENCIKWVKENEMLAAAIKKEELSMKARRQSLEKQSAWLKTYVLKAMSVLGKEKIEYPAFRLSVRNNAESVIIADGTALPSQFIKTVIEPDKQGLYKALKSGEKIEGVSLQASKSLIIK